MKKKILAAFFLALYSISTAYGAEQAAASGPGSSVEFRMVVDEKDAGCVKMAVEGTSEELCLEKEPKLTIDDVAFASLATYNKSPIDTRLASDKRKSLILKNEPKGKVQSSNIILSLTDAGRVKLAKLTYENINKRVGIIVGGKLLAAPVIRTAISTGELEISCAQPKNSIDKMLFDINSRILVRKRAEEAALSKPSH